MTARAGASFNTARSPIRAIRLSKTLFGIRIAITKSALSSTFGACRGEVMNELGDFSSARYAAIRALQTGDGPDCLLLAYPDEESLHGLIAHPASSGFGFAACEEPVASIEACLPGTGGSKSEKYQPGVHFATRRFGDRVGLAGARRMARRAMQQAMAAAIVLFYSTNAVAAAIRTFLGA
jgi:hypothetical protein